MSQLTEIFELPLASMINQPTERDLGLDVVIQKFQSGDMMDLALGDIGFSLFWRPEIVVAARIYRLDTGKVVHIANTTARVTWKQYFARLFSCKSFFRFGPMFDSSDMEVLLQKACLDLLVKLRKSV